MKHRKVLPHLCNEPLRCPECVQRFWIWLEQHTRGRPEPGDRTKRWITPKLSFYEAAAKKET